MTRSETRAQLARLRERLDDERDRDHEAIDALDSALLELDAFDSVDSRYATRREEEGARYTESIASLRSSASKYHALRAGELDEHILVTDLESGEPLAADDLDRAIERAMEAVERDQEQARPDRRSSASLLGTWAP